VGAAVVGAAVVGAAVVGAAVGMGSWSSGAALVAGHIRTDRWACPDPSGAAARPRRMIGV
jgi:hypothetical protein